MEPAVYLGVDIGKSSHYALAVDASGKPIYQTGVPNDEAALRKLVDWAKEHQATLVVDQPGGAAALLLKLCWQSEVRIGYMHGLAMRAHAISMLARARPIRKTRSCSPTSLVRIPLAWCGSSRAVRHWLIWSCCAAMTPICAPMPTA
jgi:hypothetical protein